MVLCAGMQNFARCVNPKTNAQRPRVKSPLTNTGPVLKGWAYHGGVLVVLVALLIGVPILELYVIVRVAVGIGTLQTIGLLILVSVVGAWLVRREGLWVLNRVRERLEQGQIPGNELVDGLLILVAGALMLTPGFLTDALGLVLLAPPTRIIVRTMLVRRFRHRLQINYGPIDLDR